MQYDSSALAAINMGNITLFAPGFFKGSLTPAGLGVWRAQTLPSATDTCIASYPPLYSALAHSPQRNGGRAKMIYYEVNIANDNKPEVDLAIGFTAPPYPAFRLPGWHRGSLAVHGDDGNKYVNNFLGGHGFASPFRRAETVGLGMQFSPGAGGAGIAVEVFFTRNGREEGRWNLHEETDAENHRPVVGLEGFNDVCAAIGVFEKVGFEVVFAPAQWRWRGYQG